MSLSIPQRRIDMLSVLCRLGSDAVLRTTPGGQQVANLSLAYSIGYGENKQTQWIDGKLWGERASKLVPHLTKGKQLLIYANDLVTSTYDKRDGAVGAKLKARIVDIEFTGDKRTAAPVNSSPEVPDWSDLKPPF
ncbi:single-stranded DNA-binding protein [Veronia pacifica]|nr:single-stranded DNA-binding protein [Veronia pacifica]